VPSVKIIRYPYLTRSVDAQTHSFSDSLKVSAGLRQSDGSGSFRAFICSAFLYCRLAVSDRVNLVFPSSGLPDTYCIFLITGSSQPLDAVIGQKTRCFVCAQYELLGYLYGVPFQPITAPYLTLIIKPRIFVKRQCKLRSTVVDPSPDNGRGRQAAGASPRQEEPRTQGDLVVHSTVRLNAVQRGAAQCVATLPESNKEPPAPRWRVRGNGLDPPTRKCLLCVDVNVCLHARLT